MSELSEKAVKDLSSLILKYGISADLIDIKALWDSTLSYKENKTILTKFLDEGYGKPVELTVEQRTKKEQRELEDKAHKEMIEKEEAQVKENLDKEISQIASSESPNIDKFFAYLNQYVDILIKSGKVFGLIIEGDAGLGKTYNVVRRLNTLKLENDKDYVMLNSHISPMEMYEFFWKHNTKTVVLDDISNLFEDETKVNLLMSALWSPFKKRFMNWQSSTTKITAPAQFEFSGKVIILTNRVPTSLDTLKSRCFHYEINFTYEDKIKLLYEIGKAQNIPIDIVDFIHENSSPATNLNFRTLIKIGEMSHNKDWQNLALQELKADDDRLAFLNILKTKSEVTEQIKEFVRVTGLSRRTFFRFKKSVTDIPNVRL